MVVKEIFCCLTLGLAGLLLHGFGGGGLLVFLVIFLSTNCITGETNANSWTN